MTGAPGTPDGSLLKVIHWKKGENNDLQRHHRQATAEIAGNDSLLTTVVIATVIATLICSSLLLLAYVDFDTVRIERTHARLQRNLRSAIDLCLADTAILHSGSPDTLDLFTQGSDSVTIIRKENWGLMIPPVSPSHESR